MISQTSGSIFTVISLTDDAFGAESAELRSIGDWIGGEELAVLVIGEVPGRTEPIVRVLLRALRGLSVGEIGDRVVTLDRNAAEIAGVDRTRIGFCSARKCRPEWEHGKHQASADRSKPGVEFSYGVCSWISSESRRHFLDHLFRAFPCPPVPGDLRGLTLGAALKKDLNGIPMFLEARTRQRRVAMALLLLNVRPVLDQELHDVDVVFLCRQDQRRHFELVVRVVDRRVCFDKQLSPTRDGRQKRRHGAASARGRSAP